MNEITLTKATNILKEAGCKDLYLFGSQARGVASEQSDIDIGVTGLLPSKFFNVHYKLENELGIKVDLVDFDYQSSFFNMLKRVGELKKIG